MERCCSICRLVKPIDDFEKCKDKPLGRGYRCRQCSSKRMRRYSATGVCKLKLRYDLSENDVHLLREEFRCCRICKRTPKKRRLCVDHDHASGKIRGMLCTKCNRALAAFGDNQGGLQQAINYVSDPDPLIVQINQNIAERKMKKVLNE
jgi:hypothetical protein